MPSDAINDPQVVCMADHIPCSSIQRSSVPPSGMHSVSQSCTAALPSQLRAPGLPVCLQVGPVTLAIIVMFSLILIMAAAIKDLVTRR